MESEGWLITKHKYIHATFAQEKVSVHIDETSVCCWVRKHNTSAEVCLITYCMYFGYFNFV